MFSVVFPMDTNRLKQFTASKRMYDLMPEKKEFLIFSREATEVRKYLKANGLMKHVRLFSYQVETGFNPSRAFNMGVRSAKYDRIIITSPEVLPKSNVLAQFKESPTKNIVCRVWDEDEEGEAVTSLVHNGYRDNTPGYYFLAVYNKADIAAINGWDEDFMEGYAYDDNDFGDRWVRAGLPFEIREDIQAVHQYHPRGETVLGGTITNYNHWQANNAAGITKCANGLTKITI